MQDGIAVFICSHELRPRERQFIGRQEPSVSADHMIADQQGEQFDQAGAADTACLPAADHIGLPRAARPADVAYGAAYTGHAAGDAGPFEGGAGRCRAAGDAPVPDQGHLAVGADIQVEKSAAPAGQAGSIEAGRDVAADIAGRTGCVPDRRAGHRIREKAVLSEQRLRPERRVRDANRRQAGCNVLHDGVAGKENPVKVCAFRQQAAGHLQNLFPQNL